MADQNELEKLYRDAQSALKAKEYDRAVGLLTQILVIDENYKDVSRLLAQTVKLKRRRWYNDVRIWGAVFGLIVIGLLIWIVPKLSLRATPAAEMVNPTGTAISTNPATPTITPSPMPTPIPLAWKRVSIGQEFERDTVTAFVIDPKDRDVLYAGMKNAGIYKSIDGGISWRPAHHGLVNAQVTSLQIDFQNPQILYAGTPGGIFKTEDGAANWYQFAEEIYLLMDPQDSSHLYKRDSNTIYESTDQGQTWEVVYTSKDGCPSEILGWAIHPTDGDTLFAGGGGGECGMGIFLSSDSGHTWRLLWSVPYEEVNPTYLQYLDRFSIGADKQGNYYIASTWGLIHSQSDKGEINWRFIVDFAPPAAFASTDLVYSYCDLHLCKFNLDEKQRVTLGKPDVGFFTSITISPYDPNTIYVAGRGLAVSKDGGLTWTKLNNGMGIGSIQISVSSTGRSILHLHLRECGEVHDPEQRAFQDDAGQPLYVSTNGGQNWDLSIRTGCHLLKDADGLTLYRVGQQWTWSTDGTHYLGWLWWSKDQGNTWQTEYVTDVVPPFTVVAHPFQSGTLYAYSSRTFRHPGYGGEKTYISEDYGNSWKAADATGNDLKLCYGSTLQFIDKYRPMAIDPFDGNHVFVIENGALLESQDSCETTSTFATPPNMSMNSIAFDPNNPDTIYAGTDDGAYISFDSGKTWNQINDGLLGAVVVYSIAVDKESNVYAATPYGVFKLESK